MIHDIRMLMRGELQELTAFKPSVTDKTAAQLCDELACDEVIKLSFNENPYGPSPCAMQAMRLALENVNLYPDAECKVLREGLAKLHGISEEAFFFGNGADEVIEFLAKAFLTHDDEVIMPWPTFGQFIFAAKLMGSKVRFIANDADSMAVDLAAIVQAVNSRTKFIYLCNPNNPTGVMIGQKELTEFLDCVGDDVFVVLDEAYADYVTSEDYLSGCKLMHKYNNVMVLRTFSKIYGLAGIRLGYCVANKDIVAAVEKVKSPFNINGLAQAAGAAALEDREFYRSVRARNAAQRDQVARSLALLGVKVYDSQTNFLYADIKQDAASLCEALLAEGIVIRPAANWGMPTHVRISLGNDTQNAKLMHIFSSHMHKMY